MRAEVLKQSGVFPVADIKDYDRHMKDSLWFLEFSNCVIEQTFENHDENENIMYAFFDHQGYLLKLYGKDHAVQAAKQTGLCEGTIWDERIGYNAVSRGIKDHLERTSRGREHGIAALKGYSLYFQPLRVREMPLDTYDAKTLNLGGFAVIVPANEVSYGYQLLSRTLAYSIGMTLDCDMVIKSLYHQENKGVLFLNTSMRPGDIWMTWSSRKLFEVLQIPEENLEFRSLDTFVPEKDNMSFWQMLRDKVVMKEKPVVLTIYGKKIQTIITSHVWEQPELNTTGLVAVITTPQRETLNISKKINNNSTMTFHNIIGESPAMKKVIRQAKRYAETDSNVMLMGESGVGKDIFAQAIHNASSRSGNPFVAINCGAMPRELIASELFGYESGAFTGARPKGNIGKFELANKGTIFLDEIGEMPLDLQVVLLRLVEQKQFMRLGGHRMIDVDVKIIAATNVNLIDAIQKRVFREDLYYRLSTLSMQIPPLREREGDITLLARYFIRTISKRIGRADIMELSSEAEKLLISLPWYGNVRELQNLCEMLVQLYPDEHLVIPEHIYSYDGVRRLYMNEMKPAVPDSKNTESVTLASPAYLIQKKRKYTAEEIFHALEQNHGNRNRTAEALGISRRTLYRYMVDMGLSQ